MPAQRKLDRILRVRTLQLGLVRADEARARERLASETQLRQRIDQLARGISPVESTTDAFSLIAAAHFRERLHHSAEAAAARELAARHQADRAASAAQEAKRDQTAVEKLMARAEAAETAKAIRALEDMPSFSAGLSRFRHDIC